MKKLFILLSALFSLGYVRAMEIDLTPGMLPEKIGVIKEKGEKELVLKGTATPADLTALSKLPREVERLDISALIIKGERLSKGDWFGQSVFSDRELPAYMLLGSSVKSIELPDNVVKIGKGAFAGSEIERLHLPQVEEIGEGAFKDCRNLSMVVLSNPKLTVIPAYAFAGCVSLTDLRLPIGVRHIEKKAFEKSAVRSVLLPALNLIGEYAFANCNSLEEITFMNGCKIGEGAFYGAGSLENIVGTSSVLPELAMSGLGTQKVITVDSPVVGEGAFSGANVEVLNITENVNEIAPYAFHSMPQLKSVIVRDYDQRPVVDPSAFASTDVGNVKLFVRPGDGDKWRATAVWGDFIITEEDSGVNEIEVVMSDIKIRRLGSKILVSSESPLREVTIYGVDGMMLDSRVATDLDCEIDYPAGYDVIVVRAEGESGTKIVKIAG